MHYRVKSSVLIGLLVGRLLYLGHGVTTLPPASVPNTIRLILVVIY